MSESCKEGQMLTKIKKLLSRFLPLPYTRAMEQNRELCSKVVLLQDTINSLDKRMLEISKQNCELASGQQHIKDDISKMQYSANTTNTTAKTSFTNIWNSLQDDKSKQLYMAGICVQLDKNLKPLYDYLLSTNNSKGNFITLDR